MFISLASVLACRHLTFVATVHQFGVTDLQSSDDWKQSLEAVMLCRMKRICCVSEDLRNEVLSRTGKRPTEVEVIPNWIEPLWVGREILKTGPCTPRKSVECTRICGIGRLSYEKGFDILLRSIGLLAREGYTVECDLFGDGPEKEPLARLAGELGIARNVSFHKPSRDVRRVLPSYHALVIPSRSESFGIVALEAYDASVPVIASNVAGLRSTVVHGQTGFLFQPGSPQSLAAATKVLIGSEGLAKRLAANGRKYLEGYLPNEGLKRKYVGFYAAAQLGGADGLLTDRGGK
jgi:glycosyltransferase involved in cell wall biosynthesis